MNKPNGLGFTRIVKATKCSFDGFVFAWKDEAAFRQEVLLCAVLFPAAFFIATSLIQILILIAPLFILLTVECLNSAIEAAIDRISEEIHPLSKKAKDLGSSAIFLVMLWLVITWGIVIWHNFFALRS